MRLERVARDVVHPGGNVGVDDRQQGIESRPPQRRERGGDLRLAPEPVTDLRGEHALRLGEHGSVPGRERRQVERREARK